MRSILAMTAVILLAFPVCADPIKKDKPPESEKVAKDYVEKFWKAVIDGKVEDAMKFMEAPFMGPDGKMEETLDKFKREFNQGPPPGFEIKVGEALEIKKLNPWLAKNMLKEQSAETIEAIEKHMGKDGRIVMLDMKIMGNTPPGSPFMIVKFKDSKPTIVGFGGGR